MDSFGTSLKKKVIIIMGATGTGKSRLSIDLARRFPAEIINCDKIQIYKGLDLVTNKVPQDERQGVVHHLLGAIHEPDADYGAFDFCNDAITVIEQITRSGHIPVIAGGSNSFLEALVEDPRFDFKSRYDCCFIWLDVTLPVLFSFVSKRVDQMMDAGAVDELRSMFDSKGDYGRGIRRAIGFPEMDEYLRAEARADNRKKQELLAAAIANTKANTCKLVSRQVGKINRLRNELHWPLHRIEATPAFETRGGEACDAWNDVVLKPCMEIVSRFLEGNPKTIPK